MRSDLVVLAPELFNDDLRIDSISEPLHRQALITQLAVERLVGAVLPGFARIDAGGVDVSLQQPAQDGSGDELRTIIRSQVPRRTVHAHEFRQHLDHSARTDAAADIDGQTLSRVFINYRKTLDLLAIGARIEHEIVRPDLAHVRCRQRAWAMQRHAAAWAFSRHLEPMQLPQPIGSIRAHRMTTTLEEHLDASVAVARILRGKLPHHGHRGRILPRQSRLVVHRGSGNAQQRARSPYRSTPLAYVGDLLTAN